MKKILAVVLFVMVAQPLFARCAVERISITPARPTAADDIRVVLAGGCSDGCIVHSPRVDVAAGTITIELEQYDGCILIPQPWGERVDVGRVPAGNYQLVVRTPAAELLRQPLIVRDTRISITPSFGGPGTRVVIDSRDPKICPGAPCEELPPVFFGGVRATSVQASPVGDLLVVVPPHAPGLVDVSVGILGTDGLVTAPQAFLYPDAQMDLTNEHERVLFPVAFEGPGAHGSSWTTENIVSNAGVVEATTIPRLPAGRSELPVSGRDGGLLLFIPHGLAPSFAFSSHIVDRSRRLTDAGTEIRVVHEDASGPVLRILNVPLTSESRQTLRIYDFDAIAGREATVTVALPGRVLFGISVALQHRIVCVTSPCYPEHPTYAVVNLDAIPQLRNVGAVDLLIRAKTNDAPLWGFVSITNNDTQHVTTYTPQHQPAGNVRLP